MHQQLCGAFVLLVVLAAIVSGQQYDSRARSGRFQPFFKNQSPFLPVGRLGGRQHPTYGQSLRRAPPARHLDVALPMSVLNSDGSLLLHLKDNELYGKENAETGQKLNAALLPMYVKSLEQSESPDDGIAPAEPEQDDPQASDPKELLNKLFEHFDQDSDSADVGEKRFEELLDEVQADDKVGLSFNLRDAFKRLFEKHFPLADDERANFRHNAMKSPAVFFNLKDMEKHFEKIYESLHGVDGLEDFVQKDNHGGISFNIADIIKEEQVLEEEENDNKKVKEIADDESKETDLNEKIAEGLRRNNIPVKIGDDGGLFFNLNSTQN